MRFVLEVRLGEDGVSGDVADELGRVLRYWAGNLKHFELEPGDGSVIYDSAYAEVGAWRITDDES